MKTRNTDRRRGITLFEVVVALVIFTLTLPALHTLVQMGTRYAEQSAFVSLASMKCSSQLAEVMVGAESLDSSDWTPFPAPDTNWSWKVNASDSDVDNLLQVQVSVKYEVAGSNPIQVSLCRMMMDPANRGSTQDRGIIDAALAASGATSSSSSSSSSSTGAAATGSTGATTTGGAAP
jgi:type II secretion system protein I